MTAFLPSDEEGRLAALHQHHILDTPPQQEFDDLVRLASHICGAPIAAVSLIDRNRQWFKSIVGLDVQETPRDDAFCAHTILQNDILLVPDAHADPRFSVNPLVTGDPHIRFYAGAPLVTEDGYSLGSLCVIDRVPRHLTPYQHDALRILARQVSSQIELTHRVRVQEQMIAERTAAEREHQLLAAIVEASADAIVSTDLQGSILSWNAGAERLYGYPASEMVGQPEALLVPDGESSHQSHFLPTLLLHGRMENVEVVRRHKSGVRIDVSATLSLIRDAAGVPVAASIVGRDITEKKQAEKTLEAQRQFQAALLESLQEGIVACDGTGTLTLFNQATRLFHGLPEQPLPPQQWADHFDLYTADGVTPLRTEQIPLFRALQGEVVRDTEMVIAPKCGPPRILLASGRAIHSASGEKLGAVVAMHDITEHRQSEQEMRRLAAIVEASADAIVSTDLQGSILSWNAGAERLYGYPASEMVGQPTSLLTPDGQPDMVSGVISRLQDGQSMEPVEVVRVRRDGTRFHAALTFSPIHNAAGRMAGLSCIVRDISAHIVLEQSLRESEARFRTSVDAMEEGLALQDASGTILFCNGSAERILGLTADQMTGRTSLDPRWRAVHADGTDFPGEQHPSMVALRDGAAQHNVIMGVHKPDDTLTWVNINAVPLRRSPQEPTHGVVVTFADITEQRLAEEKIKDHAVVLGFQKRELEKANAELESLATTDGLTGLKNHRAFQERLAEEASLAGRYGTPLSVVMLDVDHFKQYNDAFGHPAGDAVLKTVARILKKCARQTDLVARYGGEEFVLVLPQTDNRAAATFAERLRAAIEAHSWPVRPVTASFGVAALGIPESAVELLARADTALYCSKSTGRNRVTSGTDETGGQTEALSISPMLSAS